MTDPQPGVLNDDPQAMSLEAYNAHYSDPGLELHTIPDDVLADAEARADEVEVPEYDGDPVNMDGDDDD